MSRACPSATGVLGVFWMLITLIMSSLVLNRGPREISRLAVSLAIGTPRFYNATIARTRTRTRRRKGRGTNLLHAVLVVAPTVL
jgi:hypothetical protein